MALYQPTNITPDLVSGPENGVVFTPVGASDSRTVEVSWTVNGNSPLLAYRIEFFRNDAASTAGTDTGKVVLEEPFSPISADGTEQRFSVSLPFGVGGTYFTIAGQDTNKQGKIRITQWWGSSDAQSVVQRSLSVFRLTHRSEISVSGPVLSGGERTFTGNVELPSYALYGDSAVEWARWQILDTEGNVVQDTGRVWGATSYEWTADQLPPGTYFAVFSAHTSNGETLTAQTDEFSVLQSAVMVTGGITASCRRDISAVEVDATGRIDISGTVVGEQITQEGGLIFNQGGSGVWQIPNFASGNWGFVWTGYMNGFYDAVFRLAQQGGGSVSFGFTTEQTFETVVLSPSASLQEPQGFQEDNMALIAFVYTGGGTAAWCVGAWDGANYSVSVWGSVSFTQNTPVSVTLLPGAETRRFMLAYGESGISALRQYAESGSMETVTSEFPSAILDPGAASMFLSFPTANGKIWRSATSGGGLVYIGGIGDGITATVDDYSAANRESYTYYIIQDDGSGGGTIMQSNSVSPCFWDWLLIEAAEGGTWAKIYSAIQVFKFALNLSTGSNGNGNGPNVQPTFTPYPVVMRDTQNRQSGVLTGLIGSTVAPGKYGDSNQLRDAIRALSISKNQLFLRSRRGDFLRIAISGEITTTINDNSLEQEVTVSIPWVEIGPVDGAVVEQEGSK